MHGAFPIAPDSNSIGYPLPWSPPNNYDDTNLRCDCCDSLTDWIGSLNSFSAKQVKSWREYNDETKASSDGVWATEGGYINKSPAGKTFAALIQYGMGTLPDQSKTQSCVYNSWMENGEPRKDMFDDNGRQMSELFKREGLEVILTGHQPVGDAPWPIRIPNEENKMLWVLPCDTSFSGDTRWTSLEGYTSDGSVNLGRGSLANGRGEVAFRYVQLFGGWHVKSSL